MLGRGGGWGGTGAQTQLALVWIFLEKCFSICYLPLGQFLDSKQLCFCDLASSFVREMVYGIPQSISRKLIPVNLTFCEQKLDPVSRGCLFIRNKTPVIWGTVFQ